MGDGPRGGGACASSRIEATSTLPFRWQDAWARREALLRYVLRPKVAPERLEQRPDGLVRITLKKAYTDGTIAVDMDSLSLLCRLATRVPPPRFHTVRYAGVLAAASPWRPRIAAKAPTEEPAPASAEPDRTWPAGGYRPWAELLPNIGSPPGR